MQLKSILKRLWYSFKKREDSFNKVSLCGVPLHVLPGTCRAHTDQDDAWWFYLAKHHNVIFDIGCNVGYTALLSLINNPNKTMVLIDPNPKALQKAAQNIINNGLGSKVCYKAAFVGAMNDKTVKFYTVGAGAAGSMHASHAKTAASMNAFMVVKTVTLDHLYNTYNIKPDLIKIDVEGAETQVMEGAKQVAKETQCVFFIEMHAVENLGMEAAGDFMLNWCDTMNYKVWYLKDGTHLTDSAKIKDRGKCHLLLLPKTMTYPNYLQGVPQYAPLPNMI